MALDLTGVPAINAVVMVLKMIDRPLVSEVVRDYIKMYGGDHYSVETIGRRMRQQRAKGLLASEKVNVKGKVYSKFYYRGYV